MNTLTQDISRAQKFQAWYEREGLKQCLDDIRDAHISAMKGSHPADIAAREFCYASLNAIDDIESSIHKVIGGGKVAKKELQRIEQQTKKSKFKLIK